MIRRVGFWPLLAVIAVMALSLRLLGLNWDQNLYLHPDERFVVWVTSDLRWPASISQYFNSATSPLNPYNTDHGSFVYGTFPSFLVKAIAGIFDRDAYGQMHIVGRAVNAVADTGSVVLTAIIARRFFGSVAGTLAGMLLAFTPLFIQTAHFFTVDTIAVFFTVATFACVVRSWDRESIAWMAMAGVMVGLAGASKPNYLIALGFIALPVLELVRERGWRSLVPQMQEREYPAIAAGLTGGFVAFWTFRIAQPYAFAGPNWWNISLNSQWLDDLAYWRAVQTGLVDMKPSIQWIDRTPVVYILQNMVVWGMGVALGLVALVALGHACWRLLRSPRWPSWWFLGMVGWCLASIAMYGTGIAQNQRYLMHIYPFLTILAAGFLIELRPRFPRRWIGDLLISTVLVYTVVFGLAFASLYTRPITRIEASDWIYENVPAGSMLSNEYWDDALPLPRPGEDRSAYIGMTLDLYGGEFVNNDKVTTLVGQLSQVDYIVISSNRVIDSVVRQPERYPVAVRYYEMLLSGELGFEQIAEFRQGPEIFGIEWDDRTAEESLTVYEHPQVRIFRKTDQFSAQHVFNELNAAWGYGGVHYIPGDPLPNQMLLSEDAITAQGEQGSWEAQVGSGWIQDHPLIALWIAMQVIGIAALPLTWRAFRNLPDMGWMLAKGVGLLAMSAITLALVSWRSMPFDSRTIAISLVVLLAIGFASPRCNWDEFRYKLPRHGRAIVTGELVFLAIFLIAAILRSTQPIDPDHNLMQLTGLMRSVSLPPIDPWLSGGVLHTNWAGLLPWASIGRLLAVQPVVAYQLATVGLMALIGGIVWSLIGSRHQSWIAIAAAFAVTFGSSYAFAAGIAPIAARSSVNLLVLAGVLAVLILMHMLMTDARQRWTRYAMVALTAGAVVALSGWAMILAAVIVGMGLAISAWLHRTPSDSWWPIARRFVLELIGIIAIGVAIWYPAIRAYTATARNPVGPNLWSIADFRDEVSFALVLAVIVVVAFGAMTVLNGQLDEGAPGIVVAGVAVAVIAVLLALAWKMDAALVILLLLSLLAILAARYWLHHTSMLWSMGLILLATGLFAAAQTRRFHPDPSGASSGDLLVPIAWSMLLIAVSLAAAMVVRSKDVVVSRTGLVTAAVVAVMLIVPTVNHYRLEDWGNRSALANPAILAPQADVEAAIWMQQNLSGWPVILTADGPNFAFGGTVSAISGFPTVLGDQQAEQKMRPGWNSMVDRRAADVSTIYSGMSDWNLVAPLIDRYGVQYIVIGTEERLRFGDGILATAATAAEAGHLEHVFSTETLVIYRVIPTEPGKGT